MRHLYLFLLLVVVGASCKTRNTPTAILPKASIVYITLDYADTTLSQLLYICQQSSGLLREVTISEWDHFIPRAHIAIHFNNLTYPALQDLHNQLSQLPGVVSIKIH